MQAAAKRQPHSKKYFAYATIRIDMREKHKKFVVLSVAVAIISVFVSGARPSNVAADASLTQYTYIDTVSQFDTSTPLPVDERDQYAYRVTTLPLHGTVIQPVAFMPIVNYTPDAGYAGSDNFVVKASQGSSALPINVTMIVVGQPAARPDARTTFENNPVAVDILANDTVGEGNNLVIFGHTQGGHGVVQIGKNNTLVYIPAENYVGTDTFTYTLQDITGALVGPTTVTITVEAAAPATNAASVPTAPNTGRR